jgi:hypothetical protein
MNTDEIYGYLDCFLPNSCTFSVLPCDFLYGFEIKKYPLYLICNSQPNNDPGKHWLGLYQARRESPLVFLDSYGRGISDYDKAFSTFANQNSWKIIEGDRILQNMNSSVCGHYAIYFIHKLFKDKGCLNSIYKGFSNDTLKNDKKVENFVRKRVCKLSSVFPTTKQCCNKFCEQ